MLRPSGHHEMHGFCGPVVGRKWMTQVDAQPETPARDRRARRPVAAFLRVVGRYGAAMARHGRHIVPLSRCPRAVRAGSTASWVFMNHAIRFSPAPPATPRRATPSPANGFFTKRESRDTNHGFVESLPLGTEGLQSFFLSGSRFRLKVMTPLLGTKTQSAPVRDAPRGDTRAVRATAAKVFHESRNTRHETRNTNHGL